MTEVGARTRRVAISMVRSCISMAAMLPTALPGSARAQTTHERAFHGPYVGAHIGSILSDALITFDGVRDPAGRGRVGFGAFAGYGYAVRSFLIGAEGFLSVAADADPFTFDPAVVGFSALQLDRGPALGLTARAGYVVAHRLLVFGTLGYGASDHAYLVDGTPLDEITGTTRSGSFGAVGYGGGIEGALADGLHLRLTYWRMPGDDLSTVDFEPLIGNAGLTFFDLEPVESQFLLGVLWVF